MNLDRYQLLAQLGAGIDGVAYRASDRSDGRLVEVRLLSRARADEDRWQPLVKRLRLAALLHHAGAVAVHELQPLGDAPYVAMEWVEEDLAGELGDQKSLPAPQAVLLVRDLAAALSAAHRIGLAHGRLVAADIRLTDARQSRIDFTGLAVRVPQAASAGLDAACRAPEQAAGGTPNFAADVYSLGALLSYLITGQPPGRDLALVAGGSSGERTYPALPQLPADAAAALGELLGQLLAPDPDERPSAREVEERLTALLGLLAAPSDVGPMLSEESSSPRIRRDPPGEDRATHHSAPGLTVPSFVGPPSMAATVEQAPPAAQATVVTVPAATDASTRERLGRFRLLEKLGEGGMGSVYKAEDVTDGTVVAIKVLSSRMLKRQGAERRFHKEARLLAEVNNPYVANLLEVNEDDGVLYLALEFVAGQSLDKLLAQCRRLDEADALAILADVCRALMDAHGRGIIHRDIKPDNILVIEPEAPGPVSSVAATTDQAPAQPRWRAKLSDFGLARHIVETESLNVTRDGALVGTPLYMSPEQCTGTGVIDARTDVYGMGATLFHMLAGRPPFLADNPLSIMALHCKEPVPALQKLNPALSPGVCQIVEKALAKSPDERYADAGALLQDLERLVRGEPTSIIIHPQLPACDPRKLVQYDWTWELEASPQQLWPHVSNTERLNKAVGLPAVKFTTRPDPERGVRRQGEFRKAGMTAMWEEHPFEWIEGRRMGVLREYTRGPFKWLVSIVELSGRPGGGTTLTHRVRLEPTGLLGRGAAAVEIGIKGKRSVERVYRRIDAALTGKLGNPATVDFFVESDALSGRRRRRLDALLDKLSERGIDPEVVERLGDFLALAPAQEVARIRPLALAERLGLDADQVVAACLHGAREGLLVLLWDILCPVCRIPSEVKDTLRMLRDHEHCPACNLDFELDFANSVEMIFRAHPEIRDTELGTYCIGGPAHSPHVVAQVRIAPGERIELELNLTEGSYRFQGPQLAFALDFRVQPAATVQRWDLRLAHGPDADFPRTLKPGRQVLVLNNDSPRELVVRVERTASRTDALTAARASSLALFRELFPGEILNPGQLVSVATISLLVTDLDQAGNLYEELGDARAFALIHEHFRLLDERIRREGGALVKTVGEGLVAAFGEPVDAVKVALDLQALLAGHEETRSLRLRVGVHRGSALVATLNDHLDYFGTTVSQAAQLVGCARGGELVLTQAVAGDPQVAALLNGRGLEAEILQAHLPGLAGLVVQRLALPGPRAIV